MLSNRYILKPYPQHMTKLLDISEHMAACHGFEGKDLLMIRLLTEEMISAVNKGLLLVPGKLWFSSKDEMFTVNVSVETDVFGMSKEERRKLTKSVNADKKAGLFGVVHEFIDHLADSDEHITFPNYISMNYSEINPGPHVDIWEMNGQNWLMPKNEQTPSFEVENLEVSLLKGYADDIRVISKKKSLEMSVMKKMPTEFSFYFLSTDEK